MIQRIWASLRQYWKPKSLQDKILWPLVALMVGSVLVSTATFVFATALTRNQLVMQQVDADTQRVIAFLNGRVKEIQNAAALMAGDPTVQFGVRFDSKDGLKVLNSRAVVIRDRFDLHLVQVYNAIGETRVNLVLSSLYRETSLLDRMIVDKPVVLPISGRLLLLSRAEMPDGLGTVITGIDIETELARISNTHRLSAELFLSAAGLQVAANPKLSISIVQGKHHGYYIQRKVWMLGNTPVELVVARSTADIVRVTRTGLIVTVVSSLLTGILLIVPSVFLTRSIAGPIHRLAEAAEGLAKGNLNYQVDSLPQPFGIGREDEIGLLATAFNRMVAELRSLYGGLEDKVRLRTHSLQVAAKIARSVSASLNLKDVLDNSAVLIQEALSVPHVAIFLIDSELDAAVLQAVAGEVGQHLHMRGFYLPLSSEALVCKAARNKEPCVVQDVRAGVFFDNSILLRTVSAAAFPLLVGENVVGVLDVQSASPDSFTPEWVNLLVTLADQIAVGVHNAQMYELQRATVEHLSEADRLKNQFLAMMSHELRTPLNSIIGFSKILLKGLNGPLTDLQREDIEVIHRSGQHLLSLIDDILDISRINAGQVDLNLEMIDLASIVQDAFSTIRPLVQDRPIELVAELADNLPPVQADGRRLRQIILNLLSNAVKFTERGRVVVQAQLFRAVNLRSNGEVENLLRVSVSDTGIGIPEDKLEHIFLEFTQVDTSTTRRYQGTGLGLPITKKLIELHGGNIWVESKPGYGSTFTFVLPLQQVNRVRQPLEKNEPEKELNYAL